MHADDVLHGLHPCVMCRCMCSGMWHAAIRKVGILGWWHTGVRLSKFPQKGRNGTMKRWKVCVEVVFVLNSYILKP